MRIGGTSGCASRNSRVTVSSSTMSASVPQRRQSRLGERREDRVPGDEVGPRLGELHAVLEAPVPRHADGDRARRVGLRRLGRDRIGSGGAVCAPAGAAASAIAASSTAAPIRTWPTLMAQRLRVTHASSVARASCTDDRPLVDEDTPVPRRRAVRARERRACHRRARADHRHADRPRLPRSLPSHPTGAPAASASRGAFRLIPPARKVTLHLRGPKSIYASPVVVGGRGSRMLVLGVRAGAPSSAPCASDAVPRAPRRHLPGTLARRHRMGRRSARRTARRRATGPRSRSGRRACRPRARPGPRRHPGRLRRRRQRQPRPGRRRPCRRRPRTGRAGGC